MEKLCILIGTRKIVDWLLLKCLEKRIYKNANIPIDRVFIVLSKLQVPWNEREVMRRRLFVMTDEQKKLREIQLAELQILKILFRFATQMNWNIILRKAPFLGVMRYKSFIPWDDDIDVCMPREDFEKFIAIVHEVFLIITVCVITKNGNKRIVL